MSALADPSTGILVGETGLQPNGKTYAFSLAGGRHQRGLPRVRRHRGGRAAGGRWRTRVRQPVIYYLDTHFAYGSSNAAYNDVTDHPLGPGYLAEVRNNYTDPYTKRARC